MNSVIATFSEDMFSELLSAIQKNQTIFIIPETEDDMKHGFSLTYSGSFKLKGGTISFVDKDIIEIKDLNVDFEELWIKLNIKFKQICRDVPCAYLPTSWKCFVDPSHTKEHCIFDGDPTRSTGDVGIASLVKSMVSLRIGVYAQNQGDKWVIAGDLIPTTLDIDKSGPMDIISQRLYDGIKEIVKDNLPGGEVKDFFLKELGNIEGIIEEVTDFVEDIENRISKWLTGSWSVTGKIVEVFHELLSPNGPLFKEIFKINNPYEIMKKKTIKDVNCTGKDIDLDSVTVPLDNVGVSIEHDLMSITARFGSV